MSAAMTVGDYKLKDLVENGIKNDVLKGLKIPPKMAITIYEHDKKKGWKKTYRGPKRFNLPRKMRNKVSSIKISQYRK